MTWNLKVRRTNTVCSLDSSKVGYEIKVHTICWESITDPKYLGFVVVVVGGPKIWKKIYKKSAHTKHLLDSSWKMAIKG